MPDSKLINNIANIMVYPKQKKGYSTFFCFGEAYAGEYKSLAKPLQRRKKIGGVRLTHQGGLLRHPPRETRDA